MITLAYSPSIQDTIDRWRLQLPVPVQIDETLMTKEHLRLLIAMLMEAFDPDHQRTSPGT